MSAPAKPNSPSNPEIQIAMPDVVKFVRQLAHDLRNDLNAAELQSAYLTEIAENAELKEEIKRLREMIAEVGANLQSVTAALGQPRLTEMPYPAMELMEDLRQRVARDYPKESEKLKWDIEAGAAVLQVDPQSLLPAFVELFANAFRHGRTDEVISVTACNEKDKLVFTMREPKRDFERSTENWGREPLRPVAQGHYGLGLHRTRGIVEAHGGELQASYDKGASCLVTIVTLPVASGDR